MKKTLIYITILCAGLTVSCGKEQVLTPSMADKDRLEAMVDRTIPAVRDYLNDYGTYVLYEFDQILDFAYQFDEAKAWRDATITKLAKADVTEAMTFLEANFFDKYTKELKKEFLPRKLLICGRLNAAALGISVSPTNEKLFDHSAAANMNSMTISKLDRATIDAMTAEQKKAHIQQLNYIFVAGYIVNVRREIFVEQSFYDASSKLYGTKIEHDSPQNNRPESIFFEKGFFKPTAENVNFYPVEMEDVQLYIEHAIKMDETMKDKIIANSIMRNKMSITIKSMKDFGIAIESINPLVSEFI